MKKKTSLIIIQMNNNSIDLASSMNILQDVATKLKEQEICDWVRKEIRGYDTDENVPKYRKIMSCFEVEYWDGYTRNCQKFPELVEEVEERNSINKIINFAKLEKEIKNIKLEISVESFLNSFGNNMSHSKNYKIDVLKAFKIYSAYEYTELINRINIEVLDKFRALEQKYGKLDKYSGYNWYKKLWKGIKELVSSFKISLINNN